MVIYGKSVTELQLDICHILLIIQNSVEARNAEIDSERKSSISVSPDATHTDTNSRSSLVLFTCVFIAGSCVLAPTIGYYKTTTPSTCSPPTTPDPFMRIHEFIEGESDGITLPYRFFHKQLS
uniref:Uncharacterized protein n=1 Tax=Glossina pallidipes TaxID=7398 RepID=A0A1A9ZQ10_GLOPL